jgi:hypothetical protein
VSQQLQTPSHSQISEYVQSHHMQNETVGANAVLGGEWIPANYKRHPLILGI